MACIRSRAKAERTSQLPDEARRQRRARYLKNPDKYKAHVAVGRALKAGRLVKLESCEKCGGGPTEAHHYFGYERRFWLVVRWLCRSCHLCDHRASEPPRRLGGRP